jgi:hypothetical protein
MNLEIFDPKWRDAVAEIAKEYSIAEPELFDPDDILQAPADFLVWTPQEMPEDIDRKVDWLCKRVNGFLFLVLPWQTADQPQTWRKTIEAQLSLKEWLVFEDPEKRMICTARKFNDWRIGNVVGAMSKDDRERQIRHNAKTHAARVKVSQPDHAKPLILVCYGPSIHQTWRSAVSEAKFLGGDIATNSGAHDFMIAKGITPKYHVEIDPRPERADFSETPNKDVEYLVASVCNPALTDKLAPFNMKLFHLNDGPESRYIHEFEPDAVLIDGGACVSLRALSLFYSMGYRYFSIYGFDCSFREDMQWAGKHPGKFHKVIDAKIDGIDRTFKTSSALVTYATQFFEHVNMLPDAKFYLHGDGLLQQWAIANAKKTLRESQAA